MAEAQQFCTFTVGNLYLGIDVLRVQEVIRSQAMTQVPLAHPVVRGLINLRGQIVTAIDLRRRMDLPDRESAELPVNVVIESDDGAISLLVDDIGDVVEVDEQHFERPPDTLRGPARELITGTYKLPDRLLLVLDADAAISLPNSTREPMRASVN
jgi:purine-binding chemotaxis protein CheW